MHADIIHENHLIHRSISEMIFPANLLTGAKHPTAFSTNQLADINKTKRSYNKVHKKLNNYAQTTNACQSLV